MITDCSDEVSSDVIVEFPGVCVEFGARGCLHGSDRRVVARVLAFAGLVHALRQDRSHICPPLAGALLLSQDTPEQKTQSKFSLPQVRQLTHTLSLYWKFQSLNYIIYIYGQLDKQELINSIFLHLSCLIKFIACQ